MFSLTDQQVEIFFDKGWIKIESAIPKELTEKAVELIWEELYKNWGLLQDDKSTWQNDFYLLKENYSEGIFRECSTTRLIDSIHCLLGKDRLELDYNKLGIPFGWWPINLGLGRDREWTVPAGGWHWDGMHFINRVDSKEQGLILIAYFTNVETKGGATLVAEGSHKLVTNFLSQYPEGLEYKDAIPLFNRSHPWIRELTNSQTDISESDKKIIVTTDQILSENDHTLSNDRVKRFMEEEYIDSNGINLRVVEVLGQAGDVFLCHPFLYHCGSPNHSGNPRIMCNLNTPLKAPISLSRDSTTKHTLLEISILKALEQFQVQSGN
ncbi:phytanoyl-CoA dioxygenase family protein [Paenibacillus kobensis]|uniref:hypothetical protein n=1 Tax=Paenibacillus kobensis TaxID=59841 RepID=UPI000FD6CF79|nr:hypothetical protein [Paenibacillus kobensis]